ncbi:class I SAM-dependent methyltransferase [Flavivirga algicola]|uniref:Class I SAM-dependent methyltransferase n=1 Tax=Flavivirga algicola TaxID=2729136 RepID=A0ABX1RU70_9FLAO|nr:class I SAM-dependent methyltransferase [Flavivirga algicola]NMH87087.1 class I SAM-dependent methyltransferase [Flavivirga algicola]
MNFEKIAKQLANPSGKFGEEVASGMNTMNQFISETTYELLQIKNSESILEIGLGNGKFTKDILNYGSNIYYTGVDISKTMIAEAKKLNHNLIKKGYVDLIHADIEQMPFWDETFDKVCTINTVYFLKAPLNAFKEVFRVLANKGIFIISYRPFIEGQTLNFTQYGFREYSSEDLESLILKSDFRIIEKIEKVEPEIKFNGQIYNLKSQYFLLQKTTAINVYKK